MPSLNDITFLQNIRGRFSYSRAERFLPRFCGLVFGLAVPIGISYSLFEINEVRWPMTDDQWVCALLVPASFGLGIFLWNSAEFEYEFTGDEILYRKGGTIRWRLPINSITETRIEVLRDGTTEVWHLRAGSVSRTIIVVKSLAKHLTDCKKHARI